MVERSTLPSPILIGTSHQSDYHLPIHLTSTRETNCSASLNQSILTSFLHNQSSLSKNLPSLYTPYPTAPTAATGTAIATRPDATDTVAAAAPPTTGIDATAASAPAVNPAPTGAKDAPIPVAPTADATVDVPVTAPPATAILRPIPAFPARLSGLGSLLPMFYSFHLEVHSLHQHRDSPIENMTFFFVKCRHANSVCI